jgi:DMSO/TMAO reductase YedYZ heme-binding membrane subunit
MSWYVARAAGLVSWALLTSSVLWGLAISTKTFRGVARPSWLLDLHRYLGGLATVFVGVHVAALIADSYVHFGVADVLVPMASSWRTGAVAWGVASLYLLLAVELTSLAKRHLPRRAWRVTHALAFPLFVTGTVHMLTAGTDAHTWLVEGAMVVAVTAVAALTGTRVAGLGGAGSGRAAGEHRRGSRGGRGPLGVPPQAGERADRQRPAAQQARDRPRVGRPVGA